MSEAQTTTAPVVATSEPVTVSVPETTPAATETAAPVTETAAPVVDSEAKTEEAAPVAPETTAAATDAVAEEKVVEPVTEGQLSYKAPGILTSLISSKKEFWLSDAPIPAQNLDSYLRGEKPDVSYPVVAWASQTGKGLLFFSKKGSTSREHPQGVLPLYDATQLKKQSPHEISFRIADSTHTLKAANDAERDGWFISLEKAIELGKAEGESLRETEAYKSEIEKLYKPSIGVAVAAGAAHSRNSVEGAERQGSVEEETKKAVKSRSTSRGILNRLKGKKEELETKKEEKKEEKAEEKAETEAEAAPVAPVAEPVAAAPVEEPKEEPVAAAVEEKPKASKRGSIFGWAGLKSPAKEKDGKEAELKPEVPAKEEAAPQIPESVTADATEPITATPVVEAPKETEAASPTEKKSNFLSGLSFRNKRGRSVSPSTQLKEAPKKEETAEPVAAPVVEPAPVAEAPVAEPVAETAAPTEAASEEPKTETATKRQSVFGNLGRRASKALNRIQAPKKDAAPATEAAKDEEAAAPAVAAPTEAEPATAAATGTEAAPTDAAAQTSIGDVVPEAVNVGKPQSTPAVTASA